MAKLKFQATMQVPDGRRVEVGLSLLAYQDEGLSVVFSPALDMFGYGNTDREARNSFDEALREFLRYTSNKGTLLAELGRLGWKAAGRQAHRTFKAPEFSRLMQKNEQLQAIVNHKDFRKYEQRVELPTLTFA